MFFRSTTLFALCALLMASACGGGTRRPGGRDGGTDSGSDGSTPSMCGAGRTTASVRPVSSVTLGGIARPGPPATAA